MHQRAKNIAIVIVSSRYSIRHNIPVCDLAAMLHSVKNLLSEEMYQQKVKKE